MKHGHMLNIKEGRNTKLSCELRKITGIVQNDLIDDGGKWRQGEIRNVDPQLFQESCC